MKRSSFLKRRLSHLTFDQAFWFSSFFFLEERERKENLIGSKTVGRHFYLYDGALSAGA